MTSIIYDFMQGGIFTDGQLCKKRLTINEIEGREVCSTRK
jgi:hypothetical protein